MYGWLAAKDDSNRVAHNYTVLYILVVGFANVTAVCMHLCFRSITPVCKSKALLCEGCHTCLTSYADSSLPHQELYDALT